MVEQRRGTSEAKHAALAAQIERMRTRGEVEPVAVLCRRAEVSTAFFYRRGFKGTYLEAVADIAGTSASRVVAQAESSAASLRAENANLAATVRRQQRQLALLEARLGSAMGEVYRVSPASAAAAATDAEQRRRIRQLEDSLHAAEEDLVELRDTLEALRESNAQMQRENSRLLNRT